MIFFCAGGSSMVDFGRQGESYGNRYSQVPDLQLRQSIQSGTRSSALCTKYCVHKIKLQPGFGKSFWTSKQLHIFGAHTPFNEKNSRTILQAGPSSSSFSSPFDLVSLNNILVQFPSPGQPRSSWTKFKLPPKSHRLI